MAPHIVSIGDLVLDVILPVTLPVQPGQHQTSPERHVEPGGAANFMIAARHMGLDVSAAGAIGEDAFGALILDGLRSEGVDTAYVVAMPGSSSTLVIALTDRASGEHTFVGNYGAGPPVAYPAGLDACIAGADAMFLQGYTLAEERIAPLALRGLDRAAEAGTPVFLDAGPFLAHVPPEIVRRVVAGSALLLMTEDEVPLVSEGRTGGAAYAYLLASGPATLVVKRGPAGCTIVTRDGALALLGYPAQVVDTSGAGDCFDAAFVAGLLRGLALADCGRLANAMGAAAVGRAGAGRNAPTCADVMAILQGAGDEVNYAC